MPRAARRGSSRTVRECVKGGYSLSQKENIPLLIPQEKGRGEAPSTPHIGSLDLEELHALRSVSAVYMASP